MRGENQPDSRCLAASLKVTALFTEFILSDSEGFTFLRVFTSNAREADYMASHFAFCNYRNVPLWHVPVCQVCWEKQPRTKVHRDVNKLLTKGNHQQKHPLCFPIIFSVLQSLQTGLAHFLSGFPKQKYTYMHSIPCPWEAWEQGCPSAARCTQAAVCVEHRAAADPGLSAAHCAQTQPSSCSLESKMCLFSLPCTSPVGKRGNAPAPGHGVGLACCWHVRGALTSAHLPTAEEFSGFTGDKQVLHFRPLPPDQDLTQPGSWCQQKPRQSTLSFLFQIIS